MTKVPDELQLERATDQAADAMRALSGFMKAIEKLRADLGAPEEPALPDAAEALREAGAAVQMLGEVVAERGPSDASRLMEAAGTADEIRAAAAKIREATRALRARREGSEGA